MYTFNGRIRYSEIDHRDQLTLPALINYFQDCSTFQSEDVGMGHKELMAKNRAWILSYWQVEITRYPKLCERVQVGTFATDFQKFLGYRNFLMKTEEGEELAKAYGVTEQEISQAHHIVDRAVLLIFVSQSCLQLVRRAPDLTAGLTSGHIRSTVCDCTLPIRLRNIQITLLTCHFIGCRRTKNLRNCRVRMHICQYIFSCKQSVKKTLAVIAIHQCAEHLVLIIRYRITHISSIPPVSTSRIS